jgi:hypothetical protein
MTPVHLSLEERIAMKSVTSIRTILLVAGVATALLAGPAAATTIANPSFETGDFTGWVTQDLGVPFFPLQVGGAGVDVGFGFFTSAPTDGAFAALHGFDGGGPGTIRIGQDITLSGGENIISFDYRAAWNLINFCSGCANRLFDVNVEVAGGGANLFNQNFLTAVAGTSVLDTGNLAGSVNLSAFAGQTVRLSFDFFIPESFTGPAFFQLDNIGAAPIPEPSAALLFGVGGLVVAGRLRRR